MTMPDVLDWKLGEAQCLQATKDHGAAARLFQEALHERPTDGQLWLHFGSAQLGLEHESEAAAAFEYAQRLGGLEASALKTLGDLYLRLRLPGLALNRYQEAMEMKNGLKAEDALAAASALVSQQHWTQARGFLASVRERHKMLPKTPEHRIARRLDAMLLMKEGDQKQAITMLEEILSEDPMDGEVLLLLGDYHWQAKDYEEAEMCFERAQRVGRTEVRACLARGRLQVGLLEYAPAIKNLVRAQNLSPSAALAEYLQEVRGAAAAAGL
jgi:tetratricopeptide (TPR) repeat protein